MILVPGARLQIETAQTFLLLLQVLAKGDETF